MQFQSVVFSIPRELGVDADKGEVELDGCGDNDAIILAVNAISRRAPSACPIALTV